MALSNHLFTKRKVESPPDRPSAAPSGVKTPAASGTTSTPSAAAPAAASPVVASPATVQGGSKLTVGPNITLKGVEITNCDTLVVEGLVEAIMDSRVMQITERGAFKGSAEIDVAEIHGQFDGSLTVRQKLTIHATGKVTGTVRYTKLVVEEGGQINGDVQFGAMVARKTSGQEKPAASPGGDAGRSP